MGLGQNTDVDLTIRAKNLTEAAFKAVSTDLKGLGAQADDSGKRTRGLGSAFAGTALDAKGALGGVMAALGPIAPAIGAAFAVGAIVNATKVVGEYAGQIQDMSSRLGVGTGAVQRLSFAAEQSGTSMGAVGNAIGQMSRILVNGDAGAVGAIGKLNLSLDDLKRLSPDAAFTKIGTAIAAVPDPMQRTALAMQLLGRSGGELVPMFASLEADMGRAVVVSNSMIDRGAKLGDAWDELKGAGKGLMTTALAPLGPLLSGIASAVSTVTQTWIDFVDILDRATDSTIAQREAAEMLNSVPAPPIGNALKVPTMSADEAKKITDEIDKQIGVSVALNTELARMDKLREAAFGLDAIAKAQDMVKAIGDLPGVAKMGADQAKALGDLLDKATEAGLRNGIEIPPAWHQIQVAITAAEEARERETKAAKDALDRQVKATEAAMQLETEARRSATLAAEEARERETKAAKDALDRQVKATEAAMQLETEARRSATLEARDLDFAREEHAIEQAKRGFASRKQILEMEQALSLKKRDAAIADADYEFREKAKTLDLTTEYGRRAYAALELAHKASVDRIVEDWRQGSVRLRTITEHLTDGFIALGATMRDSLSSALSAALVHAESWKDAMLGVWRSLQQGIAHILSGILDDFLDRFLDGMIGAFSGRQGAFSNAFSGFLRLGTNASATGGGLATSALAGGALAGGALAGGAGFGAGALLSQLVDSRYLKTAVGAGGGAATGALIGTYVMPGIGTAVGAGIGALAGTAAGFLGKTNHEKANDARDKFITGVGGSENIQQATAQLYRMAEAAGITEREMRALFDAKKPQAFAQAAELVAEKLDAHGLKTAQIAQFKDLFPTILQQVAETGRLVGPELQGVIAKLQEAGGLSKELGAFTKQMAATAIGGLTTFLHAGIVDPQTNTPGVAPASRVTTQESATAMAGALAASFGELQKQGMSITEIVGLVAPAIGDLRMQMADAGLEGGAAFERIAGLVDVASDKLAGPALTAVGGLNQALVGLHNSGLMNEAMFSGLAGQVGTTFSNLVAQGTDGNAAMQLMQPTLQTIWELQQQFGFSVDSTTQSLLSQAEANGIVGETFMSTEEQMATGINRLVELVEVFLKSLGVDIPQAAVAAGRGTQAAADMAAKAAQRAEQDMLAYRDAGVLAGRELPGCWTPIGDVLEEHAVLYDENGVAIGLMATEGQTFATTMIDGCMGVAGQLDVLIGKAHSVAAAIRAIPPMPSAPSGTSGDDGTAPAFHAGGYVGWPRAHRGLAIDEVPIIAQYGEGVLSRRGMGALGGVAMLDRLNRGGALSSPADLEAAVARGMALALATSLGRRGAAPAVEVRVYLGNKEIDDRIVDVVQRNIAYGVINSPRTGLTKRPTYSRVTGSR